MGPRSTSLCVVLVFAALLAAGCRVGPDVVMWGACTPGSDPTGTDGDYVLICKGGEWVPLMTTQEYVDRLEDPSAPIAPLP